MVLSVPVFRIPPLVEPEPEPPEPQLAISSSSGTAKGSARSRSFRVIFILLAGRSISIYCRSEQNAGGSVAGCAAPFNRLQLGIDARAALLSKRAARLEAASGGYRCRIRGFSAERLSRPVVAGIARRDRGH